MNEVDKLVVTLQQMLLHIEAELSEQIDNRRQLALQSAAPDRLQAWRDAVLTYNVYKALSKRFSDVLDIFRADGV